MPFQTTVNLTQAPAVEGDFASANPRQSAVNCAEGAFASGASGLIMGRFAWIHSDGVTLNNSGSGAPQVFVKRTIVPGLATYGAESGMAYLAGMPVGDVFTEGDFWVKNTGAGASAVGNKVFASLTTGQIQFAAAGATVGGYIETKWHCLSVAAAGELAKITTTQPQ